MMAAANWYDEGSGTGREPGDHAFSEETLDALRAALREHLATPGPDAEHALRQAFRGLAHEARTLGASAERIVVLFKTLWHGMPEVRASRAPAHSAALARAVTLCIQTYYEPAEPR